VDPQEGFIFEGAKNRRPLDLDTFAKCHMNRFSRLMGSSGNGGIRSAAVLQRICIGLA